MKFSQEIRFICLLVLIAVVISAISFVPTVFGRIKNRFFFETAEAETAIEAGTEAVMQTETTLEETETIFEETERDVPDTDIDKLN